MVKRIRLNKNARVNGVNRPHKSNAGRPSLFKPEYVEQAKNYCMLGATDEELAEFFGVVVSTIFHWRHLYPEFSEATKVGKEMADNRVERSLYQRALGYKHVAEKIVYDKDVGDFKRTTYIEQYPPDTGACAFWLKNRRGKDWKDRHEHTGADGEAIQHQYSIVDELRAKLDGMNVPDKTTLH